MNSTNVSILQSRKTKAFAALFAGIFALCALASTASSAWAATVNEPIVISNPEQSAAGDGWEWVSAGSSGTLTLDGADIQVADTLGAEAAIVVPDGATIHLKGSNSIAITADSPASNDLYAAVYCEGDLTVTGDSGATATIRGEGLMDWGVYCKGDLTVTGPIALDVAATTAVSAGDDAPGATGAYVEGDLVVNGEASLSAVGSENGLIVKGATNITDADTVTLGTDNPVSNSLAASFTGNAMISGTNVFVNGSAVETWAPMSISGSDVELSIESSDRAIFAQQGLDVADGSHVKVSSKGHALYVLGELSVRDSSLHVEGVGPWSTAIRVEGDMAVDNADVTALGSLGEGGKGISILSAGGSELAGTLTLKGSPSVVAEGGQAAIQFVSLTEDFASEHVVLDPSIGAVEGGMLHYAERTFTSPDEFTMSIWAYSADPIHISDDFGVENASQRVTIDTEHSLLFVTDGGQEATGLEGIKAIASDGTEYPAVEWLDGSHVGYYRFTKDLPAGTYSVVFGSDYETADAAQITVPEDGLSIFEMNFHSIAVESSDEAQTWLVKPSTGEQVNSLEHVLCGAKVAIGTQTDHSHRFAKYEATGTTPEWEDGDATKAEQTITVCGDAIIKAAVTAAPPVDSGDTTDPDDATDHDSDASDSKTPDSKKPGASSLPSTGDSTGTIIAIAIALAALAAISATIAFVARARKQ